MARSLFDKHGQLQITWATDPWWKRLRARLMGRGIYYRVGALRDVD
jgi:hypothetical protein